MLRAVMTTLAGLALCAPALADQVAKTSDATIVNDLKYLIYTPEGYDASSEDYPLVVWLHGGGESGTDIEKLKAGGLPKMIADGQEFPFLVFSPQNPDEELLFPIERVKNALDQVVARYRVDESRIYVVGYSRGAFATWAMAEQYPSTFAAFVPIAGGGNRHYLNRTNPNAAFWVVHGEDDATIPLMDSVVMFQRLKELERNARLTVLEGVDHDEVDDEILGQPLFDWLLEQRLAASPAQ